MKRQALYACLTCVPEAKADEKKRAGVCLGCSYRCHSGHEFVELYTKRNFRCDCGTSKFTTLRCKYEPNKPEDNDLNQYNHNFSGTYCICRRPYPDPDNDDEDEMVQCVVCEDWFHTRHLETDDVPDMESFNELVCAACMKKADFLQYYTHLCVQPKGVQQNESISSAEAPEVDAIETVKESDDEAKPPEEGEKESAPEKPEVVESPEAGPSTSGEADSPSAKRRKLAGDSNKNVECTKPKAVLRKATGATFWPCDWRTELCQCDACLKMYADANVAFLTDTEDTSEHYAEKGKAKGRTTTQEMLLNAVSNLDHVTKIEVITGFNRLKSKLSEFLGSYVANKEVITESDVRDFFRTMSEGKKK